MVERSESQRDARRTTNVRFGCVNGASTLTAHSWVGFLPGPGARLASMSVATFAPPSAPKSAQGATSRRRLTFAGLLVLAWAAAAGLLLVDRWPEMGQRLFDGDDAMRLVEVRELLA